MGLINHGTRHNAGPPDLVRGVRPDSDIPERRPMAFGARHSSGTTPWTTTTRSSVPPVGFLDPPGTSRRHAGRRLHGNSRGLRGPYRFRAQTGYVEHELQRKTRAAPVGNTSVRRAYGSGDPHCRRFYGYAGRKVAISNIKRIQRTIRDTRTDRDWVAQQIGD